MIHEKQDLVGNIHERASSLLDNLMNYNYTQKLTLSKQFWAEGHQKLNTLRPSSFCGADIFHCNTFLTDLLIKKLFESVCASFEKKYIKTNYSVAVVALGDYARQEISCKSQIELLFLYPQKIDNEVLSVLLEMINKEIIYLLWDMNIKVNYYFRNIYQTIDEARNHIRSKIMQTETRLICGSVKLFKLYEKTYRNFFEKESLQECFFQLITEQTKRHKYYFNFIFLREPNILYGMGGIEDYQILFWIARLIFGSSELSYFVKRNILTEDELNIIKEGYEFLLNVRNELHKDSEYPVNILSYEKQAGIAKNLRFYQENHLNCIEAFMHEYYRYTQNIYHYSQVVINAIKEKVLTGPSRFSVKSMIQNFYGSEDLNVIDGFLYNFPFINYINKDVFIEDPLRLIRIFKHSQQYQAKLSQSLITLIKASLDLIDEDVIRNHSANITFLSILQNCGNVYKTLKLMHETGVLGKFIPEFSHLTHKVQHEYYHQYTVDVHILKCIEVLDNLFKRKQKAFEHYRIALERTSCPSLLYLMLFLHDIGKINGVSNHCDEGAKIAETILKRLGLNKNYSQLVTYVIKNHLLIFKYYQKNDIEDLKVIEAFAKDISNPELLCYLYVHTFCDAKGTHVNLWNAFKETLNTNFFLNTINFFKIEKDNNFYRLNNKAIYFERIQQEMPDYSPMQIYNLLNLYPEYYFINTNAEEMLLHLRMIHELQLQVADRSIDNSFQPILHWKNDLEQSTIIVTLVTWDKPMLFNRLSAVFVASRFSIISTCAVTRNDKVSIDVFHVAKINTNKLSLEKSRKVFESKLKSMFYSDCDVLQDIHLNKKKLSKLSLKRNKSKDMTNFPVLINIKYDYAINRILLETQALDHFGLLYSMTRAISSHGFDITYARVRTENGVAINSFKLYSDKLSNTSQTSKIILLREDLNKIINK